LTVAVIGAVVLTRRTVGEPIDLVDFPDGTALEAWEADHLVDVVDADEDADEDAELDDRLGDDVAEDSADAADDEVVS